LFSGEGGFGFVVHCRKKSTGKHYAMKLQTKKGNSRSSVFYFFALHSAMDDMCCVNRFLLLELR
jgi:serine/threonine protein kinase